MAGGKFMRRALKALDRAIAEVARAEFARLDGGLEVEEVADCVEATFESLDRLRPAKQADQPDYDEWDSLFYVSWYQPRQVHLVYAILRQLHQGRVDGLRVVDVGCGAWAVQMAAALVAAESRRKSLDCQVAVHGIDPSAAMRRLGEELWVEWRNRAAEKRGLGSLVDTMDAMSASCGTYDSYETWACSARARLVRIAGPRWWLTAVHGVYTKSFEEIEELYYSVFDRLEELHEEPCQIVTSDGSKRELVSALAWVGSEPLRADPAWSRVARHTTRWRRSLRERLDSHLGSKAKSYLKNEVKWDYPRNPIRRDSVRISR